MKGFKKSLKLLALVCLIVLAVFGVGLSGGIPIPQSNKRNDRAEINIELVEPEENEKDTVEMEVRE